MPEMSPSACIYDYAAEARLHTYMGEPHLKSGPLKQVVSAYAVDGPPISVLFPSSKQLSPEG